jgi:polysaccharide biosynthesis transport protein
VAAVVDGVVLTMRLRRNVKPLVTRAAKILESVDANVLGIVVNGVSQDAGYGYNYGYRDYRYAYQYRYGYGYRGYNNGYTYGAKKYLDDAHDVDTDLALVSDAMLNKDAAKPGDHDERA